MIAALLSLFLSFAAAEPVKTVFNPFSGKLDFITQVTSGTLPSGSTFYIQNTTGPAQPDSFFNVSSGVVRGYLNVSSITAPGGAQFGGATDRALFSSGGDLSFDGGGDYLVANDGAAFKSETLPLGANWFSTGQGGFLWTDTGGGNVALFSAIGGTGYINQSMMIGSAVAPTARLTILGAGSSAATLALGVANSVGAGAIVADDAQQVAIGYTGVPETGASLTVGGNSVVRGTETVRGNQFSVGGSTFVVNAGRVGVGTNSPSNLFQVGGGTFVVTASGLIVVGGSAVTTSSLSACGTSPTVANGSNNNAGKITIGSGGATACVMVFPVAWGKAPSCIANNERGANLVRAVPTTTQVTFSGTMAQSDSIAYICLGL